MEAFRRRAEQVAGRPLADYAALHRWSIADRAAFWQLIWDQCEVIASRAADVPCLHAEKMPGASWFPGARLNFAENLLRRSDDAPALIAYREGAPRREVSFAALRAQVGAAARTLRAWGVVAGDRVGGYLPNVPEAVVAMLAAASIGAIWSSCSPDFGEQGVLDRFGQIRPKILFAADGYVYNGKAHDRRDRLAALCAALPDLERVVVVPVLSDGGDRVELRGATPWADVLATGDGGPLRFEQLPFDHPLYVLYSSGTTGSPKCIVHGAGGTLLQHLKEHQLHTDLHPGDRLFYFTTCGWMMWNWLVSALATGATAVLFDGAPFFPDGHTLWRMAAEEEVTAFGTSARYLAALEKAGLAPGRDHDLSALRTVLSTGSPLAPESFDYVYEHIKGDVCLSSISGGTDIISCFALGNPAGPVRRGALQALGLGMAVEVYGADGAPQIGEPGELVCTRAFPSMPVGFWGDADGASYRAAYFERFEGVWHHGDWVEQTPDGGLIVHGRSDATLNPGGVRIGTAEIYGPVGTIDEVVESVVIGQPWAGDTRVVLFVRLREGVALDADLEGRIRDTIRAAASPRHVPARILAVDDIPRTLSGKVVEIAVRDVVCGREVPNRDALANPEALEHFRDRPALRS